MRWIGLFLGYLCIRFSSCPIKLNRLRAISTPIKDGIQSLVKYSKHLGPKMKRILKFEPRVKKMESSSMDVSITGISFPKYVKGFLRSTFLYEPNFSYLVLQDVT